MDQNYYPPNPQYNAPFAGCPAGSRNWAITAAIMACVITFVNVFFTSYFSSIIGIQKLYMELATIDNYSPQVVNNITLFSIIVDELVSILLGVSIIKMTNNKAGTFAGVILIVLSSLFIIFNIIIYINNNEIVDWEWMRSDAAWIVRSAITAVCMIVFSILLCKAVKGVAGKILLFGYFFSAVVILVNEINFRMLMNQMRDSYDPAISARMDLSSLIVSSILLLLYIVIITGYFVNVGNYSNGKRIV